MEAFDEHGAPLRPENAYMEYMDDIWGTEVDEVIWHTTMIPTPDSIQTIDTPTSSMGDLVALSPVHPFSAQEQGSVYRDPSLDKLAKLTAESFCTDKNLPPLPALPSGKEKRTRQIRKSSVQANNKHGRSGIGRCQQCRKWRQAVRSFSVP